MSQILSAFVCLLIALAYSKRKNLRTHVRLMGVAFLLDLSLVLYLELTRSAIHTAVTEPSLLLRFHVSVSVLSLLLYFTQFFLGWRYRSGTPRALYYHRIAGRVFLLARGLSFVTSFFIEKSV